MCYHSSLQMIQSLKKPILSYFVADFHLILQSQRTSVLWDNSFVQLKFATQISLTKSLFSSIQTEKCRQDNKNKNMVRRRAKLEELDTEAG